MEGQSCLFLGIKVKPGPTERLKLDNYSLENTVDRLKSVAETKTNVPSSSLELIHHGKILKDDLTLQKCGVKSGETIHVVKKKVPPPAPTPPTYTDLELQQLNASLRTLGCTPNAPGWTRAMQLLNDENVMADILEHAPGLADDCVGSSILHEVELLAALGANVQTMRRGANAHPDLPNALRRLMNIVFIRSDAPQNQNNVPTSGFAYSLEALSEDEDADDEENDEVERHPITQEQLVAALQAATEAVSTSSSTGQENLLRLLRSSDTPTTSSQPVTGTSRPVLITPEMFSTAITDAMNRSGNTRSNNGTPMEQSTAASSSQSPVASDEDYTSQLQHMHEMGLHDDSVNVRALIICSGDVNAAINLVFSGTFGDN